MSTTTEAPTEVAVLSSYVRDEWVAGSTDAATPVVVDAVTGAPVARISADGLDVAAAVDHARRVGGPNLREHTFTERAAMLLDVVAALNDAKDELYELSARAGSSRGDAWGDVDGGIGTMASIASRAAKKLPDSNVWVDQDLVRLSRDDTFHAVQAQVPMPGVAVQVNAFNYPVWGMLEKFAPALVAGMPCIAKPAPQAGFVAHRAFEVLVEADVLPAGAVQLVMGGSVDLLAHLDHRDVLSFTGSAATARALKGHAAIVERNVRFNAETDSVNASVLGPDVAVGSALYEDYLAEVVGQVTNKSGQRCTSIRRVLVPSEVVDRVGADLAERVGALVVGDPRRDDVDLGPLVDATQRETVLAAIERLGAGADVLAGPEPSELVGVDGDPGTFVAPTVLRARDARSAVVHDVEAFGPVVTVVAYDDPAEVAELVALGGGGLVASVFARGGGDRCDTTADLVRALAPHHGRVLVVDETSMRRQTGHGTPLARLHHGGPGRAGGGSELGGLDSLHHHLQRVAIQGSPELLMAATGRWVSGAPRATDTHPFRKDFDQLRVGDGVTSEPREVTREDVQAFADLTGDHFYAHTDEEAAARNPLFGGIVAHGYLLVALGAGLFVDPDEGPVLANTGLDDLRFMKPIRPGDTVTASLTCVAKAARPGDEHGEVRWAAELVDQDGDLAVVWELLTRVARGPS